MNPETILLDAVSAAVLDRTEIPPRRERCAPAPAGYAKGPIAAWLAQMVGPSGQPWLHQALALGQLDAGNNVVVATGTASGKSLIAMTHVIKRMLEDPTSTFVVFVPQKALLGDQLVRWKAALVNAQFDPGLVGELQGDVATDLRVEAIKRARVLLATEDAFHAWAMRNHAVPFVQAFIREIALVVIDEAHERKAVFGSTSAYLYRRITVLRARCRALASRPDAAIQWLALSATISEPAQHLEALTGCPFEVIDEASNGAPTHGLTVLHIEGPDHGAAAEAMLAEVIGRIAGEIAPDAAIAFVDGRQAVERITAQIGMDEVEPYRSGFEAQDRSAIETSLRQGKLRAVVATSALELGVDIPQFTIGLNMGVPRTKMSMRQRIGRAGRSARAVFAVVAPANAFTKLGTTFKEFLAGEVEPSVLYLANAIIQYGQARCLQDELGGHEAIITLPGGVAWPDGFAEAYAQALPGAARPREIEQVASLETGRPHLDFLMRRVCESRLKLRHAFGGEELGNIDLGKALREAYPGAFYLQRKRPYRVSEWRQTGYEQSIYLDPAPSGARTHPILSLRINVSHAQSELQEGRLLAGDRGSLAEIRLQVTEIVRGYKFGKQDHLYRDLQQSDRRKSAKQRNYSTTGVLIRIDEPWFKGHGGSAADTRKQVAEALLAVLALERGIAPSELAYAVTNIALQDPAGPRQIDDAIVIFDDVMGGMRLTAPLFAEFQALLSRLRRASELAGPEALLDEITAVRLQRWHKSLRPKDKTIDVVPALEGGQRLIYAAGSVVGIRIHGALQERRLLAPQLLTLGDCEQLFYQYAADGARTALVPHEQVEPLGHDWRQVLWDPATDTTKEIAA